MYLYRNETGCTLRYSKYVLKPIPEGEPKTADGYKRELVYDQTLEAGQEVAIELCMSTIVVVEKPSMEVEVFYADDNTRLIRFSAREVKAWELLDKVREYALEIPNHFGVDKVQRKFRIGYPLAFRVVELLQAEGTVGAYSHETRSRPVYISNIQGKA